MRLYLEKKRSEKPRIENNFRSYFFLAFYLFYWLFVSTFWVSFCIFMTVAGGGVVFFFIFIILPLCLIFSCENRS